MLILIKVDAATLFSSVTQIASFLGITLTYEAFTYGWFILTCCIIYQRHLIDCFVQHHILLYLLQLPVGAGFSWNADWPWTHHRFLHCSDARRYRRSHPRQCLSGGPEEALQKAECIWKCIPQQVDTHMHTCSKSLLKCFDERFCQKYGCRSWKHLMLYAQVKYVNMRGKDWGRARVQVRIHTAALHSCVIEFPSAHWSGFPLLMALCVCDCLCECVYVWEPVIFAESSFWKRKTAKNSFICSCGSVLTVRAHHRNKTKETVIVSGD